MPGRAKLALGRSGPLVNEWKNGVCGRLHPGDGGCACCFGLRAEAGEPRQHHRLGALNGVDKLFGWRLVLSGTVLGERCLGGVRVSGPDRAGIYSGARTAGRLHGSAPTTAFQQFFDCVRVQCARYGQDYSVGQLVPIRGSTPDQSRLLPDAVTASGSGPRSRHLPPAICRNPGDRVVDARGIGVGQVRDAVRHNQHGRLFGFIGEPVVNVLAVNLELDPIFR